MRLKFLPQLHIHLSGILFFLYSHAANTETPQNAGQKQEEQYGVHCTMTACSDKHRPDFFRQIHFPESYKSWQDKRNEPVTVIDSAIQRIPEINLLNVYQHIPSVSRKKDISSPLYLHGTAIASIIAGKPTSSDGQVFTGILPGIPVINRIVLPNNGINTSFLDAVTAAELTDNEKILNISGADIGTKNATEWAQLLKKIGQKNKIIIIASAGNDARDIATTPPEQQLWPAAYRPKRKEDIEQDPVIRVAAIQLDEGGVPRLYQTRVSGSRFGDGRVDIGAPGFNVPFLAPSGKIMTANGTSEAAAIVSGVVAAMNACTPATSPRQIKEILLRTADRHEHLKTMITEGRVLNAGKALEAICTPVTTSSSGHSPVSWNIAVVNRDYADYFLTDLPGLKAFKAGFSVSHQNDDIPFYLTTSGQIYTTAGSDGVPLCLTGADVNEASWQHIGFKPCDSSLNRVQHWELNFISEKTIVFDNFITMALKLKESNTCLRMKNHHAHWGQLFLSRCEEYTDDDSLLKLKFTPDKIGYSFTSSPAG